MHSVLQGASVHILSTKIRAPVGLKACASLFVMLDKDQVLYLQGEQNYLKRSWDLSVVVQGMSVSSGEGTLFCSRLGK